MNKLHCAALAALLLGSTVAALAADAPKGDVPKAGAPKGDGNTANLDAPESITFSRRDRNVIQQYYAEHRVGKFGKRPLPGIRKPLAVGGPIPPGMGRRMLPGTLEARLPVLPPNYERAVVGNDVLLYNFKTGLIVDIVPNAAL